MAIRQDMIVAIRKNPHSKELRIANVNDKYPICTYPADPDQVSTILLVSISLTIQFILLGIGHNFTLEG
jgi:hypothetical protein